MNIPVNALSITLLSLMLLCLVITSYLAAGYIMDFFKFKEPNQLRSAILSDINLDRRTHNFYNYLCWHIEDCTQIQPMKPGELAILCAYMTANAIEGMNRKDSSEMLQKINEMARDLSKQKPITKDKVVELTLVKDEVSGDGASIH